MDPCVASRPLGPLPSFPHGPHALASPLLLARALPLTELQAGSSERSFKVGLIPGPLLGPLNPVLARNPAKPVYQELSHR